MSYKLNGFTVVEVMIASATFVVVLSIVVTVMLTGQESFNSGNTLTSLESEATYLLDILTESLSECKILTAPSVANQHASITIQVPVISGTTYWDDSGNIYWGASGNLGWKITYTFVTQETLNEATTKRDYNQDKDILDVFERGRIVKEIRNASDVLQDTIRLGSNILVVSGAHDADINNDGMSDPLFLRLDAAGTEDVILGNRVRVNFWLSKEDPKGFPYLINAKTERKLEND